MKFISLTSIFATTLVLVAPSVGQSVPKLARVDTSYFAHRSGAPARAAASVESTMPLAVEGVRFDSPWIAYTGPLGYVFARYNGHTECALVDYAVGQWFVSFRGTPTKPFGNLASAKAVADKGCKCHAGKR